MSKNEPITRVRKVDDSVIDAGNPHDVIDPVWDNGNIYGSWEEYEQSLASFSQEQRLIFAATWYLAEVNNGGHDQFYFNSTGIVWSDAIKAFKALEAQEAIDILSESAERLGGPSYDRDQRYDQLENTGAEFDDLDRKIYDLQETLNFDRLFIEYIKNHREKFYYEIPSKESGT